jgi:hypothetical protein
VNEPLAAIPAVTANVALAEFVKKTLREDLFFSIT